MLPKNNFRFHCDMKCCVKYSKRNFDLIQDAHWLPFFFLNICRNMCGKTPRKWFIFVNYYFGLEARLCKNVLGPLRLAFYSNLLLYVWFHFRIFFNHYIRILSCLANKQMISMIFHNSQTVMHCVHQRRRLTLRLHYNSKKIHVWSLLLNQVEDLTVHSTKNGGF